MWPFKKKVIKKRPLSKEEVFDEQIRLFEMCIETCGDMPEAAFLKKKAQANLGCLLNGKPLKYTT